MDRQKQRQLQQLAQAVLETAGESYDGWLERQHLEVIVQHTGLLTGALGPKKETEGDR